MKKVKADAEEQQGAAKTRAEEAKAAYGPARC
jgi:hypothetical protein